MRPNPLNDAVQFLTQPAWFTAVFWLLLLASIAIADRRLAARTGAAHDRAISASGCCAC